MTSPMADQILNEISPLATSCAIPASVDVAITATAMISLCHHAAWNTAAQQNRHCIKAQNVPRVGRPTTRWNSNLALCVAEIPGLRAVGLSPVEGGDR